MQTTHTGWIFNGPFPLIQTEKRALSYEGRCCGSPIRWGNKKIIFIIRKCKWNNGVPSNTPSSRQGRQFPVRWTRTHAGHNTTCTVGTGTACPCCRCKATTTLQQGSQPQMDIVPLGSNKRSILRIANAHWDSKWTRKILQGGGGYLSAVKLNSGFVF